jgi:type IV fimbrial biogenesis protein FimT
MNMNLDSNRRLSSRQEGFSLLELVVVMAVMLVLSAVAIPSITQSMRQYRLNVATTNLQNLVEVARYSAIRRNTEVDLRQTTVSGQTVFFVDLAGTPTAPAALVTTDPQFYVPQGITIAPTGAPASTTALANTQALGAGCIGFNSRGVVTYTNCGTATPGVVWFLSIGLPTSVAGYRAITVTAMGQTKAWTAAYGSSAWNNM